MTPHLKIAEFLTNLLDRRFSFMGVRFGIDPIIGLIPGVGDIISFLLSLYLIWIAIKIKLPSAKISQMTKNIIIDLVIGFIPIVGDLTDFVYQANWKNLQILQSHPPIQIVEGEIISGSTT